MPTRSPIRLGEFDAFIFDLDGVVTRTARVHARAWKRLFDEFLRRRSQATGKPFVPFDLQADYRRHVDGKPRFDGVRSFLDSRSIEVPEGTGNGEVGTETIRSLGNRKNEYFQQELKEHGVEVFDSTAALIHALREGGIKTAVVSSSRNCPLVLEAAGLAPLFDARVDGNELQRLGLAGKPDPAMFLEAARRLGVEPARAVVIEDAVAGVQAGRAGRFGLVIGVDRGAGREQLERHGAEVVVDDLARLRFDELPIPRREEP